MYQSFDGSKQSCMTALKSHFSNLNLKYFLPPAKSMIVVGNNLIQTVWGGAGGMIKIHNIEYIPLCLQEVGHERVELGGRGCGGSTGPN